MSRIGKLPIQIPSGVTVTLKDNTVIVKGGKSELKFTPHRNMKIVITDKEVTVERGSNEKKDKALHGLTRTLIFNMIKGVTDGFERKLEVNGVGFRAQVQGKKLTLNLGFSHPVEVTMPEGMTVEIDKEKKNLVILKGADKQLVSEIAARIRRIKPPEPYKGKGIKYLEEHIIRKAGKTAATGKAAA